MEGRPTTFWGKLTRDARGAVSQWHPLLAHCADVGATIEALLAIPLWRARLSRLADLDCLDPSRCVRLCVLGSLHDLGKFTTCFQAKGRPDLGLTEGGHVLPAVAALAACDKRVQSCLEPLCDFGDAAFGLLVTALAHHGEPVSIDSAAGSHQESPWQPHGGLDPIEGLRALVAACRRWFPAAFEPGSPMPPSAGLEHAFAGLVMLADWIASDPSFFPFAADGEDRMAFARRQAPLVLSRMGIDLPLPGRGDHDARDPFSRVCGFPAIAAQRAMLGVPTSPAGSVTIFESETGSGKTEAALAHFVRLFERGDVDGLYFALPTRTAATQIHRRVCESVNRAFRDPPAVVLAVPGYIQVDDAVAKRLPGFEVLWPDAGRLRYRGWAAEAPKRYLAGAIVVGTIDQVLLSSLLVRHAHLRATALLRHLLVVDEVHASDTYMTRLLEDVLARHQAAGGHALLLSATLGAETRHRLLQRGSGVKGAPSLETALSTPYPLVAHRGFADEASQLSAVGHEGKPREVALSIAPDLEAPQRVVRQAFAAALAGAKVLVIRNTVADCLATQGALEELAGADAQVLFRCEGVIAPHHGRFSRDDRQILDEALERQFGKERGEGGRVIVATQTVQQSLDIDADLLFTDLCPIDVLLQRVGRLHRHARSRPCGFECPRAVVVVPAERGLEVLLRDDGTARNHHGLGSVYHDVRMLEAAWRLLEQEALWCIPEMNRSLVERGVHSKVLGEIVRKLGGRFEAHERYLLGEWLGQRRLAQLNLIDRTKPYSETCFPSRVDERIQTRLGEGDRRVQFPTPFLGPFGRRVGELSIRAAWARGVPDDAEAMDLESAEGRTFFRWGERRFVYDRLGLRPDGDAAGPAAGANDDAI